jgi:hypothetical protein
MAKIPYVDLTDTVNTHRLRTNQLIDSVGDVSSLTTTDNSTVVAAINELDSELGNISSASMGTIANTVGGAIAELDARLDSINDTMLKTVDVEATTVTATDLTAEQNLIVNGLITARANVVIGNSSSDILYITSTIGTDVVPNQDNAYDLGSTSKQYAEAHIVKVLADSAVLDRLLVNDSATFSSTIFANNIVPTGTALTTSVNSSIVGGINSLVTDRGPMGSLQTSATNNLVSAINELKFRVDLLDSDVEVNLDSAFSAIALGDSAVRVYALSLADSNRSYLITRLTTADTALGQRIDSDRLDYIARDDSDRTDILARFAAADSSLRILIDSNTDNFATNVKSKLSAGTGLTYTQGSGEFKIANISPAIPSGTYGSATAVPVLTVNARGQITSASTATVAGIDSVDFNDSTGVLRISTADGAVYSNVIGLGAATTDGLTEGNNNLYYTQARVDSDITNKVIKSYIDDLNVDADTLDGQDGTYYLNYNNFTNTPTINDATIAIANDGFLTGTASWTSNEDSATAVTIGHPVSGVTAATYGQASTENGQYIKSVTVDTRGHITGITADDFDDRYDKYTGWYVRGDAATSSQITSNRVLQFEGGDYIATTLDTSGSPWKLRIDVNTSVGSQLLIKNSAGTTLKTILGITTSV